MARYTALYDACVLYPAPLRDFLIQLSTTNLFRVRWSSEIHDEWTRNLLKNRPDLKGEQLKRTQKLMNRALPDALVTGFEALIPTLELPDANDRHVLAAAIRGRCDVIVTYNLKDFPSETLSHFDLEAQHPDEFISHLIHLKPDAILVTAKRCRARLKNPPKTVEKYVLSLADQRLPELSNFLLKNKELI